MPGTRPGMTAENAPAVPFQRAPRPGLMPRIRSSHYNRRASECERRLQSPNASYSPYRRGVLQAALGPQRVEATFDLQRRAFADVAVEHLAVIADMAHDA